MKNLKFRNRRLAERVLKKIEAFNIHARFMHVCGTHQDTLLKYGIDTLLREIGIEIRPGPGCPVCVTTPEEYEDAIALAEKGVIVTAYGDVAKSPGFNRSLLDMRVHGCDVRIVYSIRDAVDLAINYDRDVVFIGVGFETTAPSTALTIRLEPPDNFSVLCCHRYIPPVLDALLRMGEIKLQGLIEPGHVSTIIGVKPYHQISQAYNIPQVIAGFEPLDVLMAVYLLLRQLQRKEAKVENEYSRTVHEEGNLKAQEVLREVFEPYDVDWRGFPVIENSGMKIRKKYEEYDARKVYEDIIGKNKLRRVDERGCRCGEVLRGIIDPNECSLFKHVCNPSSPIGPCMVSVEGACHIEYRYGKKD